MQLILVGNKAESDLERNSNNNNDSDNNNNNNNSRQVTYAQGKELADQLSIPFVETSAKFNLHVDEAFELLLNLIDVVNDHNIHNKQQQSVNLL